MPRKTVGTLLLATVNTPDSKELETYYNISLNPDAYYHYKSRPVMHDIE